MCRSMGFHAGMEKKLLNVELPSAWWNTLPVLNTLFNINCGDSMETEYYNLINRQTYGLF